MPLITKEQLLNKAGGVQAEELHEVQQEQQDDRGVMERLGAGVASTSLVAKMATKSSLAPDLPLIGGSSPKTDKSYILSDEQMAGYEDFWDDTSLLAVDSDEKLEQWKKVVDFNRRAKEQASTGGWASMIGGVIGEVLDPTMLIPGGVAVKSVSKSAKIAKSAAASAGLIAGGEAAQEALIHQVDPTRTFEESRNEVAVAGAMGVVFGGVLGALNSTSAAMAKSEMQEIITDSKGMELRITDGVPQFHKSVGSAGASVDDIALKGINERLAKVIASPVGKGLMSPVVRGLTHPLQAIRKVTDELFQHDIAVTRSTTKEVDVTKDTSKLVTETAEAKPAIETLMRIDDLEFKRFNREIDGIYRDYAGLSTDSFAAGPRAFFRGKTQDDLMDFATFDKEVAKAIREGGEHTIPQVSQAAKMYVTKFEEFAQKLADAGMLPENITVKGAASFFPRRYNIKKILMERNQAIARGEIDAFTQKIADHFSKKNPGLEADEALDKAKKTVDRIVRQDDAALEFQHMMDNFNVKGGTKFNKARVLDIEDAEIADYLQDNASDIFNQYAYQASTMLRHDEWMKARGAEKFSDLMDEVSEEIAAGLKSGKIKPDDAEKIRTDAEEFLTDSINSVLGRITDPKQSNKLVPTAFRVLRKVLAQAQLGGVMISSAPDSVMPAYKIALGGTVADGYWAGLKRLGKTVELKNGMEVNLRKEFNDQYTDLAAGIEIQESKLIKMMLDPGEPLGQVKGTLERIVEGSAHVFGRASGIVDWNNTMKRVAAHVSVNKTARDLRKLAKGEKLHKSDSDRLSRLRLGDDQMRNRILSQIDKYSETYSGSMLPNMHLWDDGQAKTVFQAAGITEVESTIITPGKGDIPFIMQKSEVTKTLMMYKSFMTASTSKILLSGVQRRDARSAIGLLGLVSMGAMVGVTKGVIAGREPNTDIDHMIKDGISRSGVLGLQGEMLFGMYGALSATGAHSRYAGMRGVDMVLGPTFGLLKDSMSLASTGLNPDKEFTAKDARKLIKWMPYNNLFYLKNILNKAFKED